MTEVPNNSPEADILLAEEVLSVGKRPVETGKVRVSLNTETVEELVRETLRSRRIDIERVALDQRVTEAPKTRQEGDILIIPVVEEVLVVERQLVLKEEIRLRFIDGEQTAEQSVTRRVQHATVERVPAGTTAPPAVPPTNTSQD